MITARDYLRIYGREAYRDARSEGYFASHHNGQKPNDWQGLKVKRGHYLNDELRAYYLSGFDEGLKRLKSAPHWLLNDLAARFAAILQSWLKPDQWQEMQRRNALPEYEGPICASHDFCDSNMAMAQAFSATMRRDTDLQSSDDCDLWGKAWQIAKREHLTAKGMKS